MSDEHGRAEDETDFDQTQDAPQTEGHEYVEHSDGQADQDDADEGRG